MMDQNYTIEEILLAVDELQSQKSVNKTKLNKSKSIHKDYSEVPKNTLKIIEQAEKNKTKF